MGCYLELGRAVAVVAGTVELESGRLELLGLMQVAVAVGR